MASGSSAERIKKKRRPLHANDDTFHMSALGLSRFAINENVLKQGVVSFLRRHT